MRKNVKELLIVGGVLALAGTVIHTAMKYTLNKVNQEYEPTIIKDATKFAISIANRVGKSEVYGVLHTNDPVILDGEEYIMINDINNYNIFNGMKYIASDINHCEYVELLGQRLKYSSISFDHRTVSIMMRGDTVFEYVRNNSYGVLRTYLHNGTISTDSVFSVIDSKPIIEEGL